MTTGSKILDGLRDAAVGNFVRVSLPLNGKLVTWVRHDADSPEGHLALARECIADLQTQVDSFESHIEQQERALVALIDAVDAKDQKAIEDALLVGKGLTF